jgi:hypothetical protein
MKPDRRQTPRTKLVEIAYIGMGPENGGLVLDVSDGGLSFHAVAPVCQDETIHFLLSLRGHSRIEGAGEVVWTNEMKKICGLRFTSLSAGAREHLGNWTNQSRMPVAAREGDIASTAPASPGTEDPPATLEGQSTMTVEPVFAIPPAVVNHLSEPVSRPVWKNPLSLWLMFGILSTASVAAAFIYGVRVGKSEIDSAPQSTSMVDSKANPQPPDSAAAPASSPTSDSPSVPAIKPPALSDDAPTAHVDASSVPNAQTSHISGSYVNTSKTDGTPGSPPQRTLSDGGLAAGATDQEHAEVALEAGKSELAAALASLRGTNGVRDSSKAARLLWAAVANDNSTAAVVLAELYLRGDGVAKSCEQARVLLTVATKSGDVQGQEKLRELDANGCP